MVLIDQKGVLVGYYNEELDSSSLVGLRAMYPELPSLCMGLMESQRLALIAAKWLRQVYAHLNMWAREHIPEWFLPSESRVQALWDYRNVEFMAFNLWKSAKIGGEAERQHLQRVSLH
eukprot:IDg19654t1